MARVLIVGATSAIAVATARLFAGCGDQLLLAGRNEERLQTLASDLQLRGAAVVDTVVFAARPRTIVSVEMFTPLVDMAMRESPDTPGQACARFYHEAGLAVGSSRP